jgi:hypothetical protein
MLSDTRSKENTHPGNVLNIEYLLPFPSIIKTAIVEPIAFINARGIFNIIANSSSSIPFIVIPDFYIIVGP